MNKKADKINKKVIAISIVVIVLVASCVLAVIYAPNLMELMLRLHRAPPH